MGALNVIASDGSVGLVYVVDERDDGTVVILACGENEQAGVATPSARRAEMDDFFPRSRDQQHHIATVAGAGPTFELVLDTSEMPPSALRFNLREFTAAVHRAFARGEREIRLTREMAREFGLRIGHGYDGPSRFGI
jgi:hypothetical protein